MFDFEKPGEGKREMFTRTEDVITGDKLFACDEEKAKQEQKEKDAEEAEENKNAFEENQDDEPEEINNATESKEGEDPE